MKGLLRPGVIQVRGLRTTFRAKKFFLGIVVNFGKAHLRIEHIEHLVGYPLMLVK